MSRITKAKEIIKDKNIFDVLQLWDNTNSTTDDIAKKLGFNKKEVELILITYEATKMFKGINQKPNFIFLSNHYFNKNDIVFISAEVKKELDIPFRLTYDPPKNSPQIKISFKNGDNIFIEGMTFKEVIEKIKEEK